MQFIRYIIFGGNKSDFSKEMAFRYIRTECIIGISIAQSFFYVFIPKGKDISDFRYWRICPASRLHFVRQFHAHRNIPDACVVRGMLESETICIIICSQADIPEAYIRSPFSGTRGNVLFSPDTHMECRCICGACDFASQIVLCQIIVTLCVTNISFICHIAFIHDMIEAAAIIGGIILCRHNTAIAGHITICVGKCYTSIGIFTLCEIPANDKSIVFQIIISREISHFESVHCLIFTNVGCPDTIISCRMIFHKSADRICKSIGTMRNTAK